MDMKHLIENIIFRDQFEMFQEEKEGMLLEIIKKQLVLNEVNPNVGSMYGKLSIDISKISKLSQVPFIPVNMFKIFDLLTCKREDVIRVLNSSSTTSKTPSKIYLDKGTSIRQSQALINTLKSFLGVTRKPLLILDTGNVNKNKGVLNARGAAIRGISNFASSITYVMDEKDGELEINLSKLKKFEEDNKNKEILVYGFTYIIWSKFVTQLKKKDIKLSLPEMKLLHSGGWKKLISESVEKEEFDRVTAEIFGTSKSNIMDFYGMVEQLGVVFVDCECGYKHVPDFADIIIRDFNTLEEVEVGQQGIIEVLSILGTSYPSQGILTEDVGEFMGIDDCSCGRRGKYFKFRSRIEKAETRGCGDTFAEREEKK
ncbi:acyl-protein synthetase [Clostridium kluyveri]|uniref:LuxE/PaaK family acyltransferase n=1 Tax=Clostridium kluyveri TaxID=1534 RepID=UPI0022466CFC|nr:acyl-protein synthetase [Clostridium kluyveri]UZQ49498.1 acyl-protein synthetase [Clostridium kluyveri]